MQDIDELDDFDLPSVSYEVWVLGYDRFDVLTNFETLICSFADPDEAVERAEHLSLTDITTAGVVPDTVSYFVIEVETVVPVFIDGISNVGTIYRRLLENTKPAFDICVNEADYELTTTGDLRITDIEKNYKVGDYLHLMIKERLGTPPILLRVIQEETASIICEFID